MKETTTTFLVVKALREAEDLMTCEMLMKKTGRERNRVDAALSNLARCGVAERVINSDGKVWYFSLPPMFDRRSRTVEEREPETRPRTRRRPFRKTRSARHAPPPPPALSR